VLIGPRRGFADDERALMLALPNVLRLGLGHAICVPETAAIAALALVGGR